MSWSRILRYSSVVCLIAVLPVSLAYGVTIDTVRVGDAGNQADTRYASPGYGSVGYAYNIGKYEVTAGQYTAFLNAVAATDTYTLYNSYMWDNGRGCKIQRLGSPGSYTYSVADDMANRPVNVVNFWDAVRFANWLHNGQPTGDQGPLTTEDGAYAVNGYSGTFGGWVVRKPGAKWFVPSEDEWYKAAYYKGGGKNSGYWDYPTRSDAFPGRDMNDASGNNANRYPGTPYPIDNGKYTTIAGEFQNSVSPYGTFDQGGNVEEWNEAIPAQDPNYTARGERGGAFDSYPDNLSASYRWYSNPIYEYTMVGFRVANMPEGWQPVPEPSSLVAFGSGLLALAGMIRRKK